MAFDPFRLDSGREYSPDKFYTRSRNDHDHRVQFRVSVPPEIAGRVKQMVERYPQYKMTEDVIRDAIIHRLEYLVEHEPQIFLGMEMAEALGREEAACQSEQFIAKIEQERKIVSDVRDALRNMAQGQEWEWMRDYLPLLPALIEALPENYAIQVQALASEHTAMLARFGG